jgi:exonuclease III
VSTSCEKQVKKISSLLALCTTVIFLCDLRLSSKHSREDLEKTFSCNKVKNYNFYYNSSKNKRGVGMLIDKNLNYEVIDSYHDVDENILGLKVKIDNITVWLISIYGPNTNENTFFDNLNNVLTGTGTDPIIIGGDWNATVNCLNSVDNIDTLYMAAPPSIFRSQKIRDLCYVSKLMDPFRALWLEEREFTYIPRSGARNRSRIDFFLISDSILNNVSKCSIAESLSSSLFDHKSVKLYFGSDTIRASSTIYNSTINHSRFINVVTNSITDTYLNHAVPNTPNLDVYKTCLGQCINLVRNINNLECVAETEGRNADPDPALANLLLQLEQSTTICQV